MKSGHFKEVSYFPGCSLATSARENNHSLFMFCQQFGVNLIELEDWNCCGSSSAHSVAADIGFNLSARNLSLADPARPLLAACPSCYLRLKASQLELLASPSKQEDFHSRWGGAFATELKILSFFDLLADMENAGAFANLKNRLKGLRFVPYYGCMLNRPPAMRQERNFRGIMEKIMSALGAKPLPWRHPSRCCGTFLSVTRPDIASKSVGQIMAGAEEVGVDCIVTACAMCHLNIEIRSRLPGKVPVLHFSELLSLATGIGSGMGWFRRHLIDPRPMLRGRRLIA